MIERPHIRTREFVRRVQEKSKTDKALLAAEAISLIALGVFIASAIGYAANNQLDESKESAINTLKMAAIITIIYAFDILPKRPSVRQKFNDLMSIEEKPKPPKR